MSKVGLLIIISGHKFSEKQAKTDMHSTVNGVMIETLLVMVVDWQNVFFKLDQEILPGGLEFNFHLMIASKIISLIRLS